MTDPIVDRIEAALEKVRWRYPGKAIRLLYLTDDDWAAYDAAMSAEWGGRIHCFQYRGIDIRRGDRSRFFTENGCSVCVPQRLSAKTKEAA